MDKKKERLITKRGYDFYLVTSAMQKAIRRGDVRVAGYFAIELFESGFYKYVWKRLLTISAEDCWGILTKEIKALYDSFMLVNEGNKQKKKGRVFIAKAVILLALAKKSRDADHLTNLVYDREAIPKSELDKILANEEKLDIPDYAYDVHTREGRIMGKTKADFFREEYEALKPKEKGLFDDLIENS